MLPSRILHKCLFRLSKFQQKPEVFLSDYTDIKGIATSLPSICYLTLRLLNTCLPRPPPPPYRPTRCSPPPPTPTPSPAPQPGGRAWRGDHSRLRGPAGGPAEDPTPLAVDQVAGGPVAAGDPTPPAAGDRGAGGPAAEEDPRRRHHSHPAAAAQPRVRQSTPLQR